MTNDSLLGKTLDEYRLVALLGQGGMARVYRGLDLNLKRLVAIKVIDTQFRGDSEYVERFRREAQTIAQLDHPNIVRLYRYGEVDGLLYMAMQYIHGADLGYVLASYRADGARLETAEAVRLVREVGQALDYAHSHGVIHRDVKPSNIMLDQQGRAILADFGLALLTDVGTRGQILGSPHYVAPEQAISSARAVPQSDLYSLGVILYEMFTGSLPFDAPQPLDVALLHVNQAPPPPRQLAPDLSPELERVILRALAKQPEDRYPSGAALAEAVDRAVQARPAAAQYPSTISRLSVADRVKLQAARQPELVPDTEGPLSALAAASPAAQAPANMPPAARAAPGRAGPRPRSWFLLAGGLGAAMLALMAGLCGLLAFNLLGQGPGRGTPAAATQVAAVAGTATRPASATGEATTAVFIPALSGAGTPTPAPSVTPSAAPAVYHLLIAKGKDAETLFVLNVGVEALPLGPLQLGDGRGSIEGEDWEVESLASGECVAVARREARKDELPENLDCDRVGEELEREGDRRFWRDDFNVYYAGEDAGRCDEDEQQCLITIVGSSP